MGVPDFTMETAGKSVNVYGDNGTGKTTLKSAVSWLLFGKDHEGKAKFEIKTLDSLGNAIPSLEHEVEAVFMIGQETVTLKKVYKEVYTQKRGSLSKTFTGHTTDYYADGVQKKAGGYKAIVADLASEDIFHLLTSPTHFSEKLSWKDQREILTNIFGDITDNMVIASSDKLKEFPAVLDGKSVDDRKSMVKADMALTNKGIQGIPDRIDEQTRTLPELVITNPLALTEKLTSLRAQLTKQNDKVANLKAGSGVADLRTKLAGVAGEIQTVTNTYNTSVYKVIDEKRDNLKKYRDRLAELETAQQKTTAEKGVLVSEVTNVKEALVALKSDFKFIAGSVFDTSTSCPHCGALPINQTVFTEADFLEQKAKDKERNIEKGKAHAAKVQELEDRLIEIDNLINVQGLNVDDQKEVICVLEDEIANSKAGIDPLEKTPDYIKAQEAKTKLEKEVADLETGNSGLVEKAISEKEEIEAKIAEQEKHLSLLEQHQKGTSRIEELKAEEKRLSVLYEALSKDLFLIESFIKAKVAMLEESINKGFSLTKFKLFSDQINGGLTETCEVTVNGVPYGSLNNAAKVQSGLDIINTISEHHQFCPPVFVDNRESIVTLPETNAQIIGLVVDADAKTLLVNA